jgi:hypothetical protein
VSAIAIRQPLFVQLPKEKPRAAGIIAGVAGRSSRIVAVVVNCEHLDELALGGYDCHRWRILDLIGS